MKSTITITRQPTPERSEQNVQAVHSSSGVVATCPVVEKSKRNQATILTGGFGFFIEAPCLNSSKCSTCEAERDEQGAEYYGHAPQSPINVSKSAISTAPLLSKSASHVPEQGPQAAIIESKSVISTKPSPDKSERHAAVSQ